MTWKLKTSDRLALLRTENAERCMTGIAALDAALGGGLPVGRGMVIGGAPGVCKTTTAASMALHMSHNGIAVAYVAADECPTGIDSRMLQALGIPRARADNPDDEVIEFARKELDGLPLRIVDDTSIEKVFIALAREFPAATRCVIIDSIQTAWTEASEKITTPRERVTDLVRTAKRKARYKATRAAYILVSELSRGGYSSANPRDLTNDLAAFKESGAIEYAVDVAVVLRELEGGIVHVNVCKSRLGQKTAFGLLHNRERCTFSPAVLQRKETAATRLEPDILRLVGRLEQEQQPFTTKTQIVDRLQQESGRKGGRFRETAFAALAALLDRGALEFIEGHGYVTETVPQAPGLGAPGTASNEYEMSSSPQSHTPVPNPPVP